MDRLYSGGITDILDGTENNELQKYSITVYDMENIDIKLNQTINNNYYIYILATRGNGVIEINNKLYSILENSFIIISPLHVFKIISLDDDFNAKVLLTYKSILDITPSMEKVFRQLNRSLKIYSNPMLHLKEEEKLCIYENIKNIERRLNQKKHNLHAEVIQNAFIAFSLDWIDIWNNYYPILSVNKEETRSEEIFTSFIDVLRENYKEQHNVKFYASKLSLTEHHLNFVIKEITGHTVSTLIYELLYRKACILLNQSSLSVEEISEILHFSDASSFCKFFKKKSSVTPLKYRKGIIK